MTHSTNLCRLCVDIFQVGKSLYDENGRGNEMYDITLKYFHPQIVNMEESKHLTDICLSCWRRICDFHSFQASVMVAQLKLLDETKGQTKDYIVIKIDDGTKCQDTLYLNAMGTEDELKSETIDVSDELSHEITESRAHTPLPQPDIMDVDSGDEFVTDDEVQDSAAVSVDGQHHRDLYACVFCPRAFRRRANLIKHRDRMHPGKVDKQFYRKLHNEKDMGGACSELATTSNSQVQVKPDIAEADDTHDVIVLANRGEAEDDMGEKDLPAGGGNKNQKVSGENKASEDVGKGHPKRDINNLLNILKINLQCGACPESFARLALMEDHFRTKHPNEAFYVSCCSSKLTDRYLIREHLHLHNNNTAFKCHLCGNSYLYQSSLRRHISDLHPGYLTFVCEKCDKVCNSHPELRSHMRESHGYTCSICSAAFMNPRKLREHKKSHIKRPNRPAKKSC